MLARVDMPLRFQQILMLLHGMLITVKLDSEIQIKPRARIPHPPVDLYLLQMCRNRDSVFF